MASLFRAVYTGGQPRPDPPETHRVCESEDGRLQQHERRAAAPRQRAAPQPAAGGVVDQDVQDGAKGGGLVR